MSDGRVQDPDLPWLQEVEDEDAPRGISARTMLVGFLVVAVAAAVIAAAFFWLGRRDSTAGAPELIRAPSQPYKIKPHDPGGLDVGGESQATFETSAGKDVDSRLNLGAGENVVESSAEPAEAGSNQAAEEAPKPEAPPAPKPSDGTGSVIQLGAYKNTAQAERAWTALSTRFDVLSGLTKMVVPYSGGFRLRAAAASPEAARQACKAIEAGGESCFVAR